MLENRDLSPAIVKKSASRELSELTSLIRKTSRNQLIYKPATQSNKTVNNSSNRASSNIKGGESDSSRVLSSHLKELVTKAQGISHRTSDIEQMTHSLYQELRRDKFVTDRSRD